MAEIDPAMWEQLERETLAAMPELEGTIQSVSRYLFELGESEKTETLNTSREWVGMPDFEPGELPFKIIINFANERARKKFAGEHGLDFFKKETKAWITWYPFKQREDPSSLRYEQVDR